LLKKGINRDEQDIQDELNIVFIMSILVKKRINRDGHDRQDELNIVLIMLEG
jgi:hypothetical protein